MNQIETLVEKLKALDDARMGQMINDSLRLIESAVIDLVTKRQIYEQGILPTGDPIRPLDKTYPVYSSMYELYKTQLGIYQGHVDLSLTGQFLKSWSMHYYADGFEIKAGNVQRDGKNLTEELRWRYGDFEGLTDENLDRLRVMLKEALQQQLRQYIGIN
jgi:hypothetical protein